MGSWNVEGGLRDAMTLPSLGRMALNARHFARRSKRRLLPFRGVLLYHRVASSEVDPWDMCVSPEHFAAHMDVLAERGWARPLEEVARGEGRPGVAITFDDGYADNLYEAAPILHEREIPATMYISTDMLGAREGYWWDELERIFLHPGVLPEALTLEEWAPGKRWELGTDASYTAEAFARHQHWRATISPPTRRHRVCYEVWETLLPLPPPVQRQALRALKDWAGVPPPSEGAPRTLTVEEVDKLASYPGIEFGAHTLNHPALDYLDGSQQRLEIEGSKGALEDQVGHSVTSFSYPYGRYNDLTPGLVAEAGFAMACTTEGSTFRRCSPYHIPRLHVKNLGREAFAAWLNYLFC